MKRKFLDLEKTSKPFLKGDAVVYATLVVLILTLFSAFVFFVPTESAKGFLVHKHQNVVLSCYYDGAQVTVEDDFKHLVETSKTGDELIITIYTDQTKSGFNTILVSLKEQSAKMIDSTCSSSKDCTSFPAVKNSGVIFCNPHGIKISPVNFSPSGPVTGFTGGYYEK